MANVTENQKQTRRGHHLRHSKRPSPRYTADYQNPFGGAAKALAIDSDKRLREMLNNRVAVSTIRDWRRGKAKAPQWAMAVLADEYDRQLVRLEVSRYWIERAKKEASESAGL